MGCLIDLPHCTLEGVDCDEDTPPYLPKSYKDKQLIKFKSYYYFEEKDEVAKAIKSLRPHEGSKIVYYKNGIKIGTAFENIYRGTYYPAAGFYKSISVTFNFGPDFEYPPSDEYATKYRSMHEAAFEGQIEQTMADMLYLVENEPNLKLDIYYKNL